MVNGDPAGSRAELLIRAQRFADMMLERLDKGSGGKDVDEKETRMLANVVLKALKIWELALHAERPSRRLEESLNQARRKVPEAKNGEA